jgi:NAD(P)-dependent dehydrogenase (short-subunit alcohol dehydrogenase family)
MPDSSQRLVVVTGASGGLGGAVIGRFLDAGATVVGVATSWRGASPPAPRFVPLEADLRTPAGAQAVVAASLKQSNRIDCLVHLVGAFSGGTSVMLTPDEVWARMLNLNLLTASNIIRAVLPGMLEARRGRIIAVGARAGVHPAANMSAYCASKAALHALIQCLAEEVKNSGITVNAVLPSIIDTPANRSAMPSADASRWVKPESVAELIAWLASDAASDVQGALVPVYGRA